MLFTRFYYRFKPILPGALRIALRRRWARNRLAAHQSVWPINPVAAEPPEGWEAWPEGKKFAVVLTHDVEGPRGLERCPKVLDLEEKLGFRASFNFIPEGGYQVPKNLRHSVLDKGFEVGVHDLRHDGKLYWSRQTFQSHAEIINKYLKDWNAVGFRSAFMHHNLDWMHDLNILYDASTFDTDPFEPQPDGVRTIFPFWVRRSKMSSSSGTTISSSGYAALPYTLVQDFTLFIILKEQTIDIWKKKIDWIAARGGMVLVNTHPDYMALQGQPRAIDEFPIERYQELLHYIKDRYSGQYYHALPREIGSFCAKVRPERKLTSEKRVCMVSYSAYESDNRVIRYAEALASRGDSVDIVAIKRDPKQPNVETIGQVQVHRLQSRKRKDQQTKSGYLLPILRFYLAATAWLTLNHARRRYDFIHVHNVPDFLVFTALFPKLTGARVILDIHDIVPEFYASKFRAKADPLGYKILTRVERASARFADHVIISNHLWFDRFIQRSASREKCSVFINHVNRKVFFPRTSESVAGKRVILFPGGLQWHQGLDIAIRAFAQIAGAVPDVEFHIYGDGNMKEEWLELTRSLGLQNRVKFFEPLPVHKIASVMAGAFLGVVPKRADSFGNEAYSTKIMEFMSVGVPVVISSTKIDRYYFDDSVVRFFESGNSEQLAKAMLELLENSELRQSLVENAFRYVAQNSWETKKQEYLQLVDSLAT